MRRRRLLVFGLGTIAAAGCAQIAQRPGEPSVEPDVAKQLDGWNAEATSILSDALGTLRTFEVYLAFRVSSSSGSGLRTPLALSWDPPTDTSWSNATHVARSLHGRADQLFQAVANATIDQNAWRAQRDTADHAQALIGLGDRLSTYRDALDARPPGDTAAIVDLLDQAWTQWSAIAANFGISRSEPVPCAG
jgi:hypothetical protein